MDAVGYLYDYSKGKTVLCHDIVSTFYRNGEQRVPLYFAPYVKKEIAELIGISEVAVYMRRGQEHI